MTLPNLARLAAATPEGELDPNWPYLDEPEAALIAAAPEMAALLQECAEALDQVVKQHGIDWCYRQREMAWRLLARLAEFDRGLA